MCIWTRALASVPARARTSGDYSSTDSDGMRPDASKADATTPSYTNIYIYIYIYTYIVQVILITIIIVPIILIINNNNNTTNSKNNVFIVIIIIIIINNALCTTPAPKCAPTVPLVHPRTASRTPWGTAFWPPTPDEAIRSEKRLFKSPNPTYPFTLPFIQQNMYCIDKALCRIKGNVNG